MIDRSQTAAVHVLAPLHAAEQVHRPLLIPPPLPPFTPAGSCLGSCFGSGFGSGFGSVFGAIFAIFFVVFVARNQPRRRRRQRQRVHPLPVLGPRDALNHRRVLPLPRLREPRDPTAAVREDVVVRVAVFVADVDEQRHDVAPLLDPRHLAELWVGDRGDLVDDGGFEPAGAVGDGPAEMLRLALRHLGVERSERVGGWRRRGLGRPRAGRRRDDAAGRGRPGVPVLGRGGALVVCLSSFVVAIGSSRFGICIPEVVVALEGGVDGRREVADAPAPAQVLLVDRRARTLLAGSACGRPGSAGRGGHHGVREIAHELRQDGAIARDASIAPGLVLVHGGVTRGRVRGFGVRAGSEGARAWTMRRTRDGRSMRGAV